MDVSSVERRMLSGPDDVVQEKNKILSKSFVCLKGGQGKQIDDIKIINRSLATIHDQFRK